jgi:hypothetical protein
VRAGQRWWLLVSGVVKRMAWSMVPSRTSFQRSRPGRIGSPAASAEVQESGRSSFDVSDHTAPEPARQRAAETRVFQSRELAGRASMTTRAVSPPELRPPSIRVSGPRGSCTLSLSRRSRTAPAPRVVAAHDGDGMP